MERILLLNNKHFPTVFDSISVVPPAGMTKIAYTENKMLAAINQYNPKLGVARVEYLDIESQFPSFKKGKSNGLLIEEFEINPALEVTYKNNDCYVFFDGIRCVCRRILMYVFISEADENTRTAFVSQTVFPTLLDYANDYIDSPSYSIANHKFCFINILNKQITSNMILRHMASLCQAGMEYVEVFDNESISPKLLPRELKGFLEEYSSNYLSNYNALTDVYEDDNYRIEFQKKLFTWKAAKMAADKIVEKTATTVDFNGSSEKFYWIETLPMALFAYNQGYKIDYSEYVDFITAYKPRFSSKSEKFARCEVLLKYIEKYFV